LAQVCPSLKKTQFQKPRFTGKQIAIATTNAEFPIGLKRGLSELGLSVAV
jgi:hypothetical protein